MIQKAARALSEKIFNRIIRDRTRENPPHTWATEYPSRDGVQLHGWALRPPHATKGTVFLLHGFTTNCGSPLYWGWAERILSKYSAAVCSFDFRFHGRSGDGIPTFGLAECWDIQATLDEADKYGSPKPYVLIGESLGAMAAQRTAIEDSRISGAVLLHPPAWPWDAIGKSIGDFTPLVGKLVNWSYGGRDVLTEGDIRTKNGHPAHNPKVLYMMGTHDKFDIQKAKQVYDHWYNGIPATWNRWPLDAPQEKKWFVAVDGACHPEGPPNTPFTVFDWPSFWPVLDQFLEIVLKAG